MPTLASLPACVKDLIPAKGTIPDPSTFVPKLIACVKSLIAAHVPTGNVQGVLGSANLPAGVSACLSSAFSSMSGLAGGTPSSLAQLAAACAPMGSIAGLGSVPGLGSLPATGSTPAHTTGR
jgi:hypothetical protein